MKYQCYNENALAATLTLLGVNIGDMTKLYIALDQAERRGQEFGYNQGYHDGYSNSSVLPAEAHNEGYDSGYTDGYSDGGTVDPLEDAIWEFNSEDANDKVRTNAMVEGCDLDAMPTSDWEVVKAAASLDDCPF